MMDEKECIQNNKDLLDSINIKLNDKDKIKYNEEIDKNPIIEPPEEERVNIISKALEMSKSLDITSNYKFNFISGDLIGKFVSIDDTTIFIEVTGSGIVSTPSYWLKSVSSV